MEDVNSVTWNCRSHPTDWWHEVGCPHMEWTKEQLLDALIAGKRYQQNRTEELARILNEAGAGG